MNIIKSHQTDIISLFNRKDKGAFDSVYIALYKDLFIFTNNLYRNSSTQISVEDEIQEVFISLWENTKQKFHSLDNIKAYLYIALRNRFINHLNHHKVIDKFKHNILASEEYFVTEMVEVELFSLISEIESLLPQKCLEVFSEYMQGFNTDEIAEKLNKSKFTIYKQRDNAINILKDKLPKDKFIILIAVISTSNMLHQ